jgi:putative flavoprotein involved in K+ transport
MGVDEEVVVIGAGQAGLSISRELSQRGVEHVVLERARIAESWRGRWDSFCLVTPNWTVQLPGGAYDGPDPDGFMPRDDIVGHLERYAASFDAPVREGVAVSLLEPASGGVDGGWVVSTSAGAIAARHVVVASGGYQKPHRPPGWEQLPASLEVMDAESYRNPASVPEGKVLIIGSGQTGCQIAEELSRSGREVFLSCGRAPWMPRRIGDHDFVHWVFKTPFLDSTLADQPSPLARLTANFLASGRDGGHDLNWRTLQAMGVELVGHFRGVDGGDALFANDLADSVAFGDERYMALTGLIRKSCENLGIDAPDMAPPPVFVATPRERVPLDGFGAVIFTSGFRPDYKAWIRPSAAFDEMGFPIQTDGSSTVAPGLHFMGVHFQRKRRSATLFGVAEDAAVLASNLAASLHG